MPHLQLYSSKNNIYCYLYAISKYFKFEMKRSSAMNQNVEKPKKKSVGRPYGSKKDGAKVRRKIHKAEREKSKRDHMNALFLELANALEPATMNTGKSCTLTETIRILRDLIAQVDSLKKENSALLAESQYVDVEKNELKEENSAIATHIKKLQSQINGKVHSQSLWSSECSPVVGPVFVLPIQNDPKLFAEPKIPDNVTKKLRPNVSKPLPRYPSPSDSWPFNILSEKPRTD
uniref:protein IRON-RELATED TRANSCRIPTION FACTOR 3-like n=1 Tax=Erigeron canadensis TaxID=72917 RepID=UPI001CB9920B|nr:protein IRON-RELATED TRANSCRIPTION FACTOR 3-like [Erigeron canadensis]